MATNISVANHTHASLCCRRLSWAVIKRIFHFSSNTGLSVARFTSEYCSKYFFVIISRTNMKSKQIVICTIIIYTNEKLKLRKRLHWPTELIDNMFHFFFPTRTFSYSNGNEEKAKYSKHAFKTGFATITQITLENESSVAAAQSPDEHTFQTEFRRKRTETITRKSHTLVVGTVSEETLTARNIIIYCCRLSRRR